MFSEGTVQIRPFIITGFCGFLTASIFTLFISGLDNFLHFIVPVSSITFGSALSAFLVFNKPFLSQAVTGAFVALACCVLVLIYAVFNI